MLKIKNRHENYDQFCIACIQVAFSHVINLLWTKLIRNEIIELNNTKYTFVFDNWIFAFICHEIVCIVIVLAKPSNYAHAHAHTYFNCRSFRRFPLASASIYFQSISLPFNMLTGNSHFHLANAYQHRVLCDRRIHSSLGA